MPLALVFNCAYNGLGIIQELGRHGVKTHALDCRRDIGTYSRYARFHQCPNPMVAEQQFVDHLLEWGPTFHDKPVLFATNDEWVTAIARHKESLSRYYEPCVADWPAVELVIHKERFYAWAAERGYPVPRTWLPEDIGKIGRDDYPVAYKPKYRRISSDNAATAEWSRKATHERLIVIRSPIELERFLRDHEQPLTRGIIQEYVEGLSDCMYTVAVYANRSHDVLGVFTGRKVRGFPPDVGDCIVGQAEAVPKELVAIAKSICKDIGYTGIAEFEYKRDRVSGKYCLIEINPRTWSWVGITPFCGVSLPWIAFCDLTGQHQVSYTEIAVETGSVKWVRYLDDMVNCLGLNQVEGFPEWHMTFRQWRRSLCADRLIKADFAMDDPIPGMYSLYRSRRQLWRLLINRILQRRPGSSADTSDVD